MTNEGEGGGRSADSVGRPGPAWTGSGETRRTAAATPTRPWERARLLRGGAGTFTVGPARLALAGFWRRAAGYIIDEFVFALAASLLVVAVASALGVMADRTAVLVVNLLVRVAYFWVWNSIGWSPGKRVVGLRIVDDVGEPPGAERGFGRTVVSLVSALAFLIGYIWAYWDPRCQTWHDRMAGTYVVAPPREGSDR